MGKHIHHLFTQCFTVAWTSHILSTFLLFILLSIYVPIIPWVKLGCVIRFKLSMNSNIRVYNIPWPTSPWYSCNSSHFSQLLLDMFSCLFMWLFQSFPKNIVEIFLFKKSLDSIRNPPLKEYYEIFSSSHLNRLLS